MKKQTVFALLAILVLTLSACGTPPPAAPTLLPTQQTVIPTSIIYPTFTPAPLATAISYPTLTPLPTEIPYPTASVVNANAVAFIAENALWVANVDGSGERKLTDIENNAERTSNYLLKWSPDGKWISYISGDDLWIISPDGSIKRKILSIQDTHQKIIRKYEWSPDSSKIAYIQAANWFDRPSITLGLFDLATEKISELSSYQSPTTVTLSWSPDKRYLLLSKANSFFVFEVNTRSFVKEIKSNDDCPTAWHDGVMWSPNGKWFYHNYYSNGGYAFDWRCVSGMDGSNRQIHIEGASYLPVWDKTKNILYFTIRANNLNNDLNLDTEQQLLRYDVVTQKAESIFSLKEKTSQHQYVWTTSISPNGRIVEMDSTTSENQQSYIFVDLESLTVTRFEVSEIPNTRLFFNSITYWSADSQNIILLSQSNGCFYKLDIQTGKTTIISGKHSVESWAVSPVATTP